MDQIVQAPGDVREGARAVDTFARGLRDLRISVIDRCNLRCRYCMPKESFGADFPFLPSSRLLGFDQIVRAVRILTGLGVDKIRLTGGEPLIRRHLEDLVARIAGLGVRDIALTTNGLLLDAGKARRLKAAGLGRVTVSLDALDRDTFAAVTDSRIEPERVLEAIDVASEAGLGPVKVNMVVQRGVNEHCVVPMAKHFRGTGHILRFIEFMDVGRSNGWSPAEVISAAEIRDVVGQRWPLEPLPPRYPGEVARRYRYRDGDGEVGFIASVTQPFCRGCTRLRLTADGQLYTCLFAGAAHDLGARLRSGAADAEIAGWLAGIWGRRDDRYSELRKQRGRMETGRREMWQIGG